MSRVSAVHRKLISFYCLRLTWNLFLKCKTNEFSPSILFFQKKNGYCGPLTRVNKNFIRRICNE